MKNKKQIKESNTPITLSDAMDACGYTEYYAKKMREQLLILKLANRNKKRKQEEGKIWEN